MDDHELMTQSTYDPNRLLDAVKDKLGLKNDAALSRAMEVAPPVISKIRHKKLPIGASVLVRINEMTDMSVQEMRELMGDRRRRIRISPVDGMPKDNRPAQEIDHTGTTGGGHA